MSKRNSSLDIEGRQALHRQASELLVKSSFSQAEKLLQEALAKYGPHVGVLSDICAIHYMTQNFSAFHDSVELLQEEFNRSEDSLDDESYLKTTLTLGKFCEELLLLDDATVFYGLQRVKTSADVVIDELIRKHEIQQLRLFSSLDYPVKELSSLYKKLVSANAQSVDLDIELSHALLLAELELQSPLIAYQRLQGILISNPASFDARLAFFDFLEVALRKKTLSDDLQNKLKSDLTKYSCLVDFDDYELALLSFLNEEKEKQQAALLSLRLSPFCRLKVISLLAQQGLAQDLYGSYRLLTEGLNTKSKDLVDKSFGSVFLSNKMLLGFASDGRVTLGSQVTDIKAGSLPHKLITHLMTGQALTTEQAITLIYSEELSESTALKLRVLISRINKSAFEVSGLPKIIAVKDGRISLLLNLSVG